MVDFGSPAWNAMKTGQTPTWESVKQAYTSNGRTFRDFVNDYYPQGPGANQDLNIPPRPNPEAPGDSQIIDWPAIKQAWQQRLGARNLPATQSAGGPPTVPPGSSGGPPAAAPGGPPGGPQGGGGPLEPYTMQGQVIPPEGVAGGPVAARTPPTIEGVAGGQVAPRTPTTFGGVLADLQAGGAGGAGGVGGGLDIPQSVLNRLLGLGGGFGAGLATFLNPSPTNQNELSGPTRDRLNRWIAEGTQNQAPEQFVSGSRPSSVNPAEERFISGSRPKTQRRPVIPARPAVMTEQYVPEKVAVPAQASAPAPAPAPAPSAPPIEWDKIFSGGGARG